MRVHQSLHIRDTQHTTVHRSIDRSVNRDWAKVDWAVYVRNVKEVDLIYTSNLSVWRTHKANTDSKEININLIGTGGPSQINEYAERSQDKPRLTGNTFFLKHYGSTQKIQRYF